MNDSQIQRAAELLQKEFGTEWQAIAGMLGTEGLRKRVGKELTSFMAFPERGNGGDSHWRGNCSPEVVASILRYVLDCKRYYGKDVSQFTLMDPMSGSGTSQAVADHFQVRSLLYDLNPVPTYGYGNWNALRNDVEDSADLIFFHPPYHDIIKYSGNMWGRPHPDDLSRCENYQDFLEKLNYCIRKFFFALRKDGRLAVLVGDIRKDGHFYSMQNDLMRMGEFESFLVKGQFNCVSDNRRYKKPFMEKSYWMTLDHVSQTEEEQENTYLSGFSARAVIHGDWIEWSITELDIPAPSDKIKMTDLKLDIWNEWLREKQQKLEEILSTLSPYENTGRYYRIAGHIDGLIDALTMQTIVEKGNRFQKKLEGFRRKLLATGAYDSNECYMKGKP